MKFNIKLISKDCKFYRHTKNGDIKTYDGAGFNVNYQDMVDGKSRELASYIVIDKKEALEQEDPTIYILNKVVEELSQLFVMVENGPDVR